MLHGSQTRAQMCSRRCAFLTRLTRLFSRKMVILYHFSMIFPMIIQDLGFNQPKIKQFSCTPPLPNTTLPPHQTTHHTKKKNTPKSPNPIIFFSHGQSQKEIFVNEIHVDTIDKHQNLSTSGSRGPTVIVCVCWKSFWCGGDILWDLDLFF